MTGPCYKHTNMNPRPQEPIEPRPEGYFSFIVRWLRTAQGEPRGHLIESVSGVQHPFVGVQALLKLIEQLAGQTPPAQQHEEENHDPHKE